MVHNTVHMGIRDRAIKSSRSAANPIALSGKVVKAATRGTANQQRVARKTQGSE
jgi:hypothetical protein